MLKEKWKEIGGYNGKYQVSNLGNVKTFHYGGRLLKFGDDTRGYITIALSKNNKSKTFKLHRIVAQAFKPNPLKLREVNHIDCNKNNNKASNLEWVSPKQNMEHASRLGRIKASYGEDNHLSKLTKEKVKTIRENKNKEFHSQLAKRYGVSRPAITAIINRKTWKHIK